MNTLVYSDEAWGNYYTGITPRIINVDNLDKANTLALYLYGALERPKDNNGDDLVADYIEFR